MDSLKMNKYDTMKVIYSGAFKNVYVVKCISTRQQYIMKEVDLKSLSPMEQKEALDEAEFLSQLRHDNIIRLREAWIAEVKWLTMIMEQAEGDLYTRIMNQKGVPFPERMILTWFSQICLALQFIHSKNILHGDLKSKNIFFDHNNVIKVGNFGIARRLQRPIELKGTLVGTPYYMPPEIFERKRNTYKSDMWSLGCILFEMTALGHAFQAKDFYKLSLAVLNGKRQMLPRSCCRIIKEIVEVLLKIEPEERPSAAEVLQYTALQPYLPEGYTVSQSTRGNCGSFLAEKSEVKPGPSFLKRSPLFNPKVSHPLISNNGQKSNWEHKASSQNYTFKLDKARKSNVSSCNNGANGYSSNNTKCDLADQTFEFRSGYCSHSQCHLCVLDTLYEDGTVTGAVDSVEYYTLNVDLRVLYQDLFQSLHRSLLYYYYGTNDLILEKELQDIMHVLSYEQLDNLPLMVRFIQLDHLMRSRK